MTTVAVVCADFETARAALAGGDHVVLIGDDAPRLGLAAARLRAEGGVGSRVSVFVGDPSLSPVWSTAAAMAAEQFRSEVRIVMPGGLSGLSGLSGSGGPTGSSRVAGDDLPPRP